MNVSGPELDKLVDDIREWYFDLREKLIAYFEEGPYVYGTIQLTEAEQLTRYLEMTPADFDAMRMSRVRRYWGKPNAYALADKDISVFRNHMERLRQRLSGMPVSPTATTPRLGQAPSYEEIRARIFGSTSGSTSGQFMEQFGGTPQSRTQG